MSNKVVALHKGLVPADKDKIKIHVKLDAKDIFFLNQNVSKFGSVDAVITGCMRKVRKDLAEREIARLRARKKREAASVKDVFAALSDASKDAKKKAKGESATQKTPALTDGREKKKPTQKKPTQKKPTTKSKDDTKTFLLVTAVVTLAVIIIMMLVKG